MDYKCSYCMLWKPETEFHVRRNATRPVSYSCKTCSQLRYYKDQHKHPIGKCNHCGLDRALFHNKLCRKCMKALGLRECKTCHAIQPVALAFAGAKGVCRTCSMQKDRGWMDKENRRLDNRLRKQYGITLEELEECRARQDGSKLDVRVARLEMELAQSKDKLNHAQFELTQTQKLVAEHQKLKVEANWLLSVINNTLDYLDEPRKRNMPALVDLLKTARKKLSNINT